MEQISILLPVFNESAAVEKTISSINEVLRNTEIRYEIIVINDGSTDGTSDILKSINDIKLINHPVNCGYGKSLKTGILAAKHDWILILDADGTYPVDHITLLLERMGKGFDMVVGARTGEHYHGNFLKSPARVLFRWLCEFATGRKIIDINSGFRIFRKSMVLKFFDSLCDGFSFTTTITLAAFLSGFFVDYVPIPYSERSGESKVNYIRDTLRTAQIIVESILYYNPIKIFLAMSLFLFILGTLSFVLWAFFGSRLLWVFVYVCFFNSILSVLIGFVSVVIKKKG